MLISRLVRNQFQIPLERPHFGVEIEVENVPFDRMHMVVEDVPWNLVPDGSLRNAGMEFLSRYPWTRKEVEVESHRFYGWYDRYKFRSGVRTSTHVHVNVLGMHVEQVRAAIAVHALLEPILFRFCGPTREENIYCVPWYRAPSDMRIVREMQNDVNSVLEACKYSSLYLEPILRFGTLEFRHAPVFSTPEELIQWVEMCERIVYSGFNNPAHVMKTWEELTVDEFVYGIFGERLTPLLRRVASSDFEELLDKYDTESIAEQSRCTYNEQTKVDSWFLPRHSVEGTGTNGYHRHVDTSRGIPPMRHDDREELYDEEEW